MTNRVLLKKSSVAAKVPLSTDLEFGELALNYADGKLYYKNSSNTISSISSGSPAGQGFTSTLTTAALSITGASGASGTATLTFATQGSEPYAVNSYISVAGVGNTGYNGLYQVTACTTASVSYFNATTAASSGGTAVAPVFLTKDSSVYQLIAATSTQSAFVLPDVTTLQPGWSFKIINGTSNSVQMQVYTFGGTNIVSAQQNTGYNFTCISASANDAAGWRFGVSEVYSGVSGTQTTGSPGTLVLSAGPTLTSPTITGTLNFTGTSSNSASFGTAQTTGQMQIGGTGQTGLIRLGQSTASQPIQIGMGAVAAATTAVATGSTISGTTFTAGTITSGTFSVGMTLSGTNVLPGTYITAGSATSWTVNQTQTVASTTITGTTQKSIDIGTGGASGSITAITLGSSTSGATSTTSVNGKLNTGALNVAAGSSGINISNGGTVTAITRTANGSGYTSAPSVAISAPTTAGGVQAVLQPTMYLVDIPTIAGGGTGYTVGDVLTLSGGTFTTAAQITVATVSAGVITSVTVTTNGNYTALPSNPVSVTGGAGSNATFTVGWRVFGCNITAAGSGYVEQPTVTFSGGGGSGAVAYATVGSIPTIKSVGSAVSFATPGGEQARVIDVAGAVNYVQLRGNQTGSSPTIRAAGSDAAVDLSFSSQATGVIKFWTNNITAEQLRVAHTASAVNYVQVTGSVTGGSPTITSEGADTQQSLYLRGKGSTGDVRLGTSFGIYFRAFGVASTNTVNYLQAQGSATGISPVLSVAGTDNNIDLVLTPKGTGVVVVNTNLGITSLTASTSATTADQVLATFDPTLYRTIKLTVQATAGTNYHSTEILAVHNGSTANHTEYGTVTVGSACASYTVDYLVGTPSTVRLLATPTSATATTYKIAAYLTKI